MAKKDKTGLSASLGDRKINIKKANTNIAEVEKKVEQLHNEKPLNISKNEVVNIQVTVDKELHTKIKLYCVERGIKIKDLMGDFTVKGAKSLKII